MANLTIAQVRHQYPQYNDMSDQQLADALHAKYYSDMPKDTFYQKIGVNSSPSVVIRRLAQSAPVQAVLGAGDAIENDLASAINLIPGVNLPRVKTGDGTAYNVGRFGGHLASFAGGGGLADLGLGAAKALPYVGEAVGAFRGAKRLGGVGRRALGAAAFGGATNQDNRGMAALGGLALSPVFEGVGNVALGGLRQGIKKAALWNARRQAKKGLALTPAETAENIAQNYTDAAGKQLPVDLGSAVNEPISRNVYRALRYVPGSGAAAKTGQIGRAQAQRAIEQRDASLQAAQTNAQGIGQELTQVRNQDPVGPQLRQLQDMGVQAQALGEQLDQIPAVVDNLVTGIPDRAQLTTALKDAVRKQYKANQATANELYAPINSSKFRLDQGGRMPNLPTYGSAVNSLLAQRENFQNLFDDSMLGANLNRQLNKAEAFQNNSPEFGAELAEVLQHQRELAKLAASANGAGKRYEASLLGGMAQGLQQDLDSVLRQRGESALANQLQAANAHYRSRVVPYWQNSTIRKAAEDKDFIPKTDTLAKALHDPNHHGILAELPNNAKNAALYQLLTKGKGSAEGFSNMTPEQVAAAYQGIPVDAKRAIAGYNPFANTRLEELPQKLEMHKRLNKQANDLRKDIEIRQKAQEKAEKQLETELGKQEKIIEQEEGRAEKAKNTKFGLNTPTSNFRSFGLDALKAAAAGGLALHSPLLTAATLGLANRAEKALTDPALIRAYINRMELPGRQLTPFQQRLEPIGRLSGKAILANILAGGAQ